MRVASRSETIHEEDGSLKRLLIEKVNNSRDEIIEFTKKLISIPTENPPGTGYTECIDMIASTLDDIGLDHEVIEVPTNDSVFPRYCINAFHGTGYRTLYFHGHYDVVPASSDRQFVPSEEDGKILGRGSSDMKGGIASMIYAIKAIKESGIDLPGRIGLTIVPDEETGGLLGSQYLFRKGILGKDGIGMLTAEPTGGVIWNASRGAITMRVDVKGKPAHVGLHFQGINAFEKMLIVGNSLVELKKKIETRKTGFNIAPDEAKRSILLIGGICRGGTNFNLVPAECSFSIDRRINPEEDLEKEKRALLDLFERLKNDGIDMNVEIFQEGNSSGSSENDAVGQALSRSIEDATGKQPSFEMCPGLLETRFYADKGVPAFGYGPGLLSVAHGPDEFIRVEDINRCALIYALTAVDLIGKK